MAKSKTASVRRCMKYVSSRCLVALLLATSFIAMSLGGYLGFVVGIALSSGTLIVAFSTTLGAILGGTLAVFCFRLCRSSGMPNDSNDDEFDIELGFNVRECFCGDDSDEEEECCWDPSAPCTCDWEVFFENLIKRILNVTCTLVCNLFCCCSEDDDNSSTTSSKPQKGHSDPTPPNSIAVEVPGDQQFEKLLKKERLCAKDSDAPPDKVLEIEKESADGKGNGVSLFIQPYRFFIGPLFSLWSSVTNYELFIDQSFSDDEFDEEKGNGGESK